jgi:hypothetical protein
VSHDPRLVNRAHWNERAPAHAASGDYGFNRFASDPSHLSGVVTFDLPRLGPIAGLRGIHLQCGIGALCWPPDIRRWAEVVAALLRPGGTLFLREGHPMLFTLAEVGPDGRLVVEDPYFERDEATAVVRQGTYVETPKEFSQNVTYQWNHGLGEVVTALLDQGMELTALYEHDSVPWEALPGQMERIELGEWRLRQRPFRLPLTYTLKAVKRGTHQATG